MGLQPGCKGPLWLALKVSKHVKTDMRRQPTDWNVNALHEHPHVNTAVYRSPWLHGSTVLLEDR